MLFEITTVLLAGLLTAFVAGNNLSAAVGTIIGSRTISRTWGIFIGISGFVLGLLLEGQRMQSAVDALLPQSQVYVTYALFISLLIFLAAAITRSPLSLTMALAGASVGISIKVGYSYDIGFMRLVIIAWVLAPALSIAFSYILNHLVSVYKFKNVWRTAAILKISLIVASFLTAFTLGANTLGFIADVAGYNVIVLSVMCAGIVLGSLFLSRGVIKRVGEEMYLMRYSNAFISLIVSSLLVEFATLVGIPLSNTQTLTSSVFGTGLSYKYKLLYLKPFLIVLLTWIISPLFGFLMGLLV